MNRLLHYSRYLFRAKGRHGTHSPFVYAFVEQVMRSRARTPLKSTAPLRAKEADLLYRTIRYLSPQSIYTTPGLLPVLQALAPAAVPGCTVSVFSPLQPLTVTAESTLIVTEAHDMPAAYAATLPGTGRTGILCYGIHRGKDTLARWLQVAASPMFQMSLDYWHFGLLVKDPAFKAKQHFRLR